MNRRPASSDTKSLKGPPATATPADLCKQLKRCSSLEQILLDELQGMFSEGTVEPNTQWIEKTLDRLCETIDREFTLMEANGYLSEVLAERPSLDGVVSGLRETHDELRADLKNIRNLLTVPLSQKQVTRVMRQRFENWMQRFGRLKHRETEVIQEAFTTDLGAGE